MSITPESAERSPAQTFQEWGVEYRGVTVYESEAEARRQLNFALWDVPAFLVKREVTVTAWEPAK